MYYIYLIKSFHAIAEIYKVSLSLLRVSLLVDLQYNYSTDTVFINHDIFQFSDKI